MCAFVSMAFGVVRLLYYPSCPHTQLSNTKHLCTIMSQFLFLILNTKSFEYSPVMNGKATKLNSSFHAFHCFCVAQIVSDRTFGSSRTCHISHPTPGFSRPAGSVSRLSTTEFGLTLQ